MKLPTSRDIKAWLIIVEWLGDPLLYVFVSFFGPDRAQRSIAFLSFWSYWPIKQFVNKKQRIAQNQGASNITYSTVVFNFDVCRLS